MATVSLDGVRKSFADREVVHGVSCEVGDGELVVVVGPSGCGKSTLLRMVAGLETVSGGTVAIDGRIVNGVEPKDRDIAMVFQNYALYPHMSVYDNMAYGLRMRRMSRAEIRSRVGRAAEILQLDGLLQRRPRQLSGGQRQRVAMGRAIVRDPKVFLFDEPLSNLDAQLRVQMRVEIKRLQQELATTSLYVTHDQVEAMTLADRLIVMNAGVGLRPEHLDLAPDGPLALRVELLERLGADTILHGRLTDGVRMIARTAANFAPPLGDIARFAIRPGHIHLFDPDSGQRP